MSKFHLRLRELRNLRGLSQQELADKLKISKSSVNMYERGEREPGINTLEAIADFFNVDMNFLLGKSDSTAHIVVHEPSNIASIEEHNVYCVPVFESVAAGFGTHASSDVLGYIPVIIRNPYDVPNTLSIRVQGDSMYPKIENGDLIVVRKQDCLESGEIGVVMLDGEDGLVKRVVYGDDRIELQSINPEYAPRRFEGEETLRLRIVGKVVGIYKEP